MIRSATFPLPGEKQAVLFKWSIYYSGIPFFSELFHPSRLHYDMLRYFAIKDCIESKCPPGADPNDYMPYGYTGFLLLLSRLGILKSFFCRFPLASQQAAGAEGQPCSSRALTRRPSRPRSCCPTPRTATWSTGARAASRRAPRWTQRLVGRAGARPARAAGAAAAIGVGGQQHGMVALDAAGRWSGRRCCGTTCVRRRSSTELVGQLGGRQACAERDRERAGRVVHRDQAALAGRERARQRGPDARRAAAARLADLEAGRRRCRAPARPPTAVTRRAPATTRRASGEWLPGLLARGARPGPAGALPRRRRARRGGGAHRWRRAARPPAPATTWPPRSASAWADGDVVVSIGTSGTAFASADGPSADPSGAVAGFADATGRYLPLVCTINAARVLAVAAGLLGVDHDELADLALPRQPGAGGLTLLPYLDGERTPTGRDATGVLRGLTSTTRPGRTWPGPPSRRCCARWPTRSTRCSPGRAAAAGAADRRRGPRRGGPRGSRPAIFGVPVAVPAARRVRRARAPPGRRPGRCPGAPSRRGGRPRAAEYTGRAEPAVRQRHVGCGTTRRAGRPADRVTATREPRPTGRNASEH